MTEGRLYNCSVPLHLEPMHDDVWDDYVTALKKMGADRVFLNAPGLRHNDDFSMEKYRKFSNLLSDRIKFFNSHGIDVGFWMGPTLGWGAIPPGGETPFQQIVGPAGKEAEGIFCPLDTGFRDFFSSAMQIIAESGVGLIILEDDFRLHLRAPDIPFGCFCPLHIEEFRKRSGTDLTRAEIVDRVLHGKPNMIRNLWLDVIGESLMNFAADVEKSVHKVNPSARIGMTGVMSHWSNEGVDMAALLKKFAGGTRPFLRTIGAPYWSAEPSHVSWIVEYTRLQAHWLKGNDVEMLAEGDTFPHTRFHCSAAMLHAFRQGLLASGFTGMLNYGIVLAPPPSHETGYINKTSKSLKNYDSICRFFPENYKDCGVNPIETNNNFKNITMPQDPSVTMMQWPDESASIHYLCRLGIPLAYDDNEGPVFLSGYGAYGMSDMQLERLLARGAIVDAVAAGWLMERGIDMGIQEMIPQKPPRFEHFVDKEFCGGYCGEYIWLITPGEGIFYKCHLKPEAKVLSQIEDSDKKVLYPGSIHYENSDGYRFCILPVDLQKSRCTDRHQLILDYARQEQLTRSLAWVNRSPLVVTVNAQPNVHVICRISPENDRIAIAVQNANLDPIDNIVLRLNPDLKVGKEIQLLLPGAEKDMVSSDFNYVNDGTYGYLTIYCDIPPMEILGVGLASGNL